MSTGTWLAEVNGLEGSAAMDDPSYAQVHFIDDPVATVSGQFALCRSSWIEEIGDHPGVGTRPWGLRDLVPTAADSVPLPAMRYDYERQMSVLDDGTGRAFIDVTAGPPTAPTTQTVDGEDPPSSEDWKNDYAPDDPACPF